MTQPEYLTFDRFQDKTLAVDLYKLLIDNGFDAVVSDESASVDAAFAFNDLEKAYHVKLKPGEFTKAEGFLENLVLGDLDQVPEDYYLYSFSDEELHELIAHRDQWSPFDFMLAQKLLRDRGKAVSQEQLQAIRNRRLDELAEPEKDQSGWILGGYLFALLGGLAGLIIGWHLSSFKKTLPNGRRVYAFTENNRSHGRRIFYLSIFVLAACILLWFNSTIL